MQESLHGPPLLPRRPLRAGGVCALPEDSAHHAVHVLRLREGDEVTLFNGRGGEFAARIASMQRLKISIDLLQHRAIERESPLRVTLVQGVSSGERMDSTLRKAVELGVAEVQPVLATRSVARPKGERAEGRRAHWQKVVIAACEQCGRNKVPDVQPLVPVADYRPAAGGAKILLSPSSQLPLSKLSFTESRSSWPRGRRPVLRKTKRPGWSRPASCRPRSGPGCSGRIRQRLRRWLR
jgi:16S rRNA (uracil1498-N3)-methyltransferase